LATLAVAALLGLALLGATPITADADRMRVGSAINIFPRYGYLSISMRVVHRNDSGWLFREPTVDVFQNITPLPKQPSP